MCSVNDHMSGVLACQCKSGFYTGSFGFCSANATCAAEQPVLTGYVVSLSHTAWSGGTGEGGRNGAMDESIDGEGGGGGI
jgi:hypothetical protein